MKWGGGCSLRVGRTATGGANCEGLDASAGLHRWSCPSSMVQRGGSHPLPQQHASICHALHLQTLTLLVLHDFDHGSVSAPLQLFKLGSHITSQVPVCLLGRRPGQHFLQPSRRGLPSACRHSNDALECAGAATACSCCNHSGCENDGVQERKSAWLYWPYHLQRQTACGCTPFQQPVCS